MYDLKLLSKINDCDMMNIFVAVVCFSFLSLSSTTLQEKSKIPKIKHKMNNINVFRYEVFHHYRLFYMYRHPANIM